MTDAHPLELRRNISLSVALQPFDKSGYKGALADAKITAEAAEDGSLALVTVPLLARTRIDSSDDSPVWGWRDTNTEEVRGRLSEHNEYGRKGDELVITLNAFRPITLPGTRLKRAIDNDERTPNYGFQLEQAEFDDLVSRLRTGALPTYRQAEFLEEIRGGESPLLSEHAVVATIGEARQAPKGYHKNSEHLGNTTGQRWTGGQNDQLIRRTDAKFQTGKFGIHSFYGNELPDGKAEGRLVGLDGYYGVFSGDIGNDGGFLGVAPEALDALVNCTIGPRTGPSEREVQAEVHQYLRTTPALELTLKGAGDAVHRAFARYE